MIAGFAVRVCVSLLLADNHKLYYEYMAIAQNILDGKGYSFDEWGRAPLQPSSFLPPGYVLWCVFWMWLSPLNYLPMYIAQAAVAASGALPAFLLGRRMFSERTGWVFAVFYSFFPEFIFLHSRPVAEFLYVVLTLWMLYIYTLLMNETAGSRRAVWLSVALGVISGISILVKEGSAVVIAVIGLVLLWRKRPVIPAIKSHLVPCAVATLLLMSPWMIRNSIIAGHFVPIRNGYGITMWLGNHHRATGTDKMPDGSYILKYMPQYLEGYDTFNRSLPPDEYRRDVAYRQEGKKFIKQYPQEYASLCAKRLLYFLWFDPTHPIARSMIYRLGYLFLLILGTVGGIVAWRRKLLDPIFPFLYIGYLALYVPILVLPRYRIIPVTVLMLLSSYFVSLLFDWYATRRSTISVC